MDSPSSLAADRMVRALAVLFFDGDGKLYRKALRTPIDSVEHTLGSRLAAGLPCRLFADDTRRRDPSCQPDESRR
ncbi:hypothetical protein ABLT15_05735 [Paraburkholderia tropica]|uniref:hypothetical protein n=2 Tax=Paraburkholderia tropica TaxID=92647 RepID=UPI0007ED39C2|nr:hypothetical protein A6456_28120 [Paraburkholderia tropica]